MLKRYGVMQLLQYLQQSHAHVSYERILSGDGLVSLYKFCVQDKEYLGNDTTMSSLDSPAGITAAWVSENAENNLAAGVFTVQRQETLSQLQETNRKTEAEHRALSQNMPTAPDAGWMASVETERKERQGRIAAAQSEVDTVNRQLQEVRGKLAAIKTEVDSLNEQRKALAGARAQDEQAFESRSGEIQQSRAASLAELGRLGMENRLTNVADHDFESAHRALEALEKTNAEIDLRKEALKGYQPRPFHGGLGMLAVALVLLFALYSGLSALFHEEEPYEWDYLNEPIETGTQ